MHLEFGKPTEGKNEPHGWIQLIFVSLFIILVSFFYFWNIFDVPFHPDESTQIYTSADVDLFILEPLSLSWKPQTPLDARMLYRLLDAPFSRTWIGISRILNHVPVQPADWDWSLGWITNMKKGAFPSLDQLAVGRFASSVFFPFDLFLLFFIGRKLRGNLLGWLMMVLFCVNALVLLHSRRAMSEGALLFFILFSLWAFLQNPRFLFLSAIPVAFAFNTKYSALPFFVIGLFAVIYRNWFPTLSRRRLFFQIPTYCGLFLLITLLLNPFMWQSPLQAVIAAFIARKSLLTRQITDLGTVSQGWISDSIGKRLGSIIANLYLTQPAFHDVGNYIRETQQSEINYAAVIYQNLFRGMIWGSLMLIISVLGFLFAILKTLKNEFNQRPYLLIFLVGTILQFIFLVWAFSIPFQRYVVPLIPFSILWIAYAINELIARIKKTRLPE
jgi:hypothetical protein